MIKNKKKEECYLVIKRIFDIFIGIIGSLLIIPIFLFILIYKILTRNKEKIFFTQIRIGKNGKSFKLIKFQTMVNDAEKILEDILKDEDKKREYEENKKIEDDKRITKIGKILRITSLDELPQFINVLKGEMSVVGNRPYILTEKEDMGEYYEEIIKVKPGITGYWQVNGRSNCTFKQRLELEEYYSKNRCLWLDIKIFFKTFFIIFCKGAK